MSKKEYCLQHPVTAYYSGHGGVEIHGIEYGIENYIYCTVGAWTGKKSHHKLKVFFDTSGDAYIKYHGYKIPLNECIRTGAY